MKFKPKNKVFLAPMEEVNDIAFRFLCKKAGCGLTYTGMIHPQSKQKIYLEDKPALQLFCTTTKGIKEFIKKHNRKVLMWDFNLGCPAKTAKKHGFGSFLKDLEMIEKIIKTIKENTKKLVSVKIRKSDIAFDVLKIAEKYCDLICIHPRTPAQGYSGKPDLKFAEQIKKQSTIPVIYSGNVDEKNYNSLLKKFDYVMIGREAIGKPEIFAKTSGNKKFKKSFKDYLKLAGKYDLPFRQIKFQAMNFTKGLRNSRKLRLEIFKIKTIKELEKIK
jgi:tRNA-dihydrouridine synthase B